MNMDKVYNSPCLKVQCPSCDALPSKPCVPYTKRRYTLKGERCAVVEPHVCREFRYKMEKRNGHVD